MARKAYTGGPLNKLNGQAGISAPHNSVSVSGLVKAHKPKSTEELEKLIADHVGVKCSCGIVSKGTIQDFGRNLYEAQRQYWGEYRFSLQECTQWEYDLFILQMLKGNLMEDKCKEKIQKLLNNDLIISDASKYIDEELRVDLEISKMSTPIAGIQVKPSSYHNVRQNIQSFNANANEKYGKPVFYVFYDYESEDLINVEQIASEIKELSVKTG